MTTIKKDESIVNLVSKFPETKHILYTLGFVEIVKPGMINTAGRVMNLEKGGKFKQIPMELIVKVFHELGFEIQ